MTQWVTVKIPEDLAKEIDSKIGKHGYTSRSDVVKDALRDFLAKKE